VTPAICRLTLPSARLCTWLHSLLDYSWFVQARCSSVAMSPVAAATNVSHCTVVARRCSIFLRARRDRDAAARVEWNQGGHRRGTAPTCVPPRWIRTARAARRMIRAARGVFKRRLALARGFPARQPGTGPAEVPGQRPASAAWPLSGCHGLGLAA
jgi:hypothetical protein